MPVQKNFVDFSVDLFHPRLLGVRPKNAEQYYDHIYPVANLDETGNGLFPSGETGPIMSDSILDINIFSSADGLTLSPITLKALAPYLHDGETAFNYTVFPGTDDEELYAWDDSSPWRNVDNSTYFFPSGTIVEFAGTSALTSLGDPAVFWHVANENKGVIFPFNNYYYFANAFDGYNGLDTGSSALTYLLIRRSGDAFVADYIYVTPNANIQMTDSRPFLFSHVFANIPGPGNSDSLSIYKWVIFGIRMDANLQQFAPDINDFEAIVITENA